VDESTLEKERWEFLKGKNRISLNLKTNETYQQLQRELAQGNIESILGLQNKAIVEH
jgi:hypothetical protein